MVKDIDLSGVVLSRDLNNYNPYFVINYNKGSNPTLVTSGKIKTQSIKYFPNQKYKIEKKFRKLVEISLKLKKFIIVKLILNFV